MQALSDWFKEGCERAVAWHASQVAGGFFLQKIDSNW
jgi:hypothetical protein